MDECCQVCGKLAWYKCGRCNNVAYCSKECQVKAWDKGGHQYTCSPNVEIRSSFNKKHVETNANKTGACMTKRYKGMGLFARKHFEVGDEILREKPLVVLPHPLLDDLEASSVENFATDLAERIFSKLHPTENALIMDLYDMEEEEVGRKTPGGIARTNTLPLTKRGDGGLFCSNEPETSGLFLLACRINHACYTAANARYHWRSDLEMEVVTAIRPIKVGDEITATYIGKYMPRQERHDVLFRSFRFHCQCSMCTSPNSDYMDEQLRTIKTLTDAVMELPKDDPRVLMSMCQKVLQIMKEMEMDTPNDLGIVHFDAYQIAQFVGDVPCMLHHIRRAWECTKQVEGESSPSAEFMANEMHRTIGLSSSLHELTTTRSCGMDNSCQVDTIKGKS